MVTKYEEIAHDIIDTVEDQIRSKHKPVDLFVRIVNFCHYCGNTLLYGEPYYELETEIAAKLEQLILTPSFWVESFDGLARLRESTKTRRL